MISLLGGVTGAAQHDVGTVVGVDVGVSAGAATGIDWVDGLDDGVVWAVWLVLPGPKVHAAAKSAATLNNPRPLPNPLIFR